MSVRYQAYATFLPNQFGGVLKFFGSEATEAFWDAVWDKVEGLTDYDRAEAGHLPLQLKRTFLRWAPAGGRVLEAGCGLATFTVAVTALGFDAEGVDYAPRVIDRVRARYPDLPVRVGDVRRLDADDGTYDAIYSPGVVEHFEEGPEMILREAHRVLKPGGVLVVSTPCFNVMLRTMHRFGGLRKKAEGEFFQYAFSERHMSRILDDAGFTVVQVHQYGVLLTLTEHVPLIRLIPLGRFKNLIAAGLDSLPLVRRCGHTCIWVARRPMQ